MTDVLDVLDSEVDAIGKVLAALKDRAAAKSQNYESFEREIRDRFAQIGFTVDVSWYRYGIEGRPGAVEGSAMPEITITGRTDPGHVFDHDRMVHEVTNNLLGIPGQEGIIRTNKDSCKELIAGHAHRRRRSKPDAS